MSARTRRLVLIAVAGGLAALAGSSTLTAAASPATSTGGSTTTTLPHVVAIGGGLAFGGASITGPGLAEPRRLDAYQAAVFVQSWIATEYFGHPHHERPPGNLAVYRVDVDGYWGGPYARLAVYYASDGNQRVWIGFPAQPSATTTPSTRPPVPSGWFAALPRVRQAFEGTAKLVPTAGTQGAATVVPPTEPLPTSGAATGTSTGTAGHGGGHGNAVWLWIALVAGAAALATTVAGRVRARSEARTAAGAGGRRPMR